MFGAKSDQGCEFELELELEELGLFSELELEK